MRGAAVSPLAVSAFLCFVVLLASGFATAMADLPPELARIAHAAFPTALIGMMLFDSAYLREKRERDRE